MTSGCVGTDCDDDHHHCKGIDCIGIGCIGPQCFDDGMCLGSSCSIRICTGTNCVDGVCIGPGCVPRGGPSGDGDDAVSHETWASSASSSWCNAEVLMETPRYLAKRLHDLYIPFLQLILLGTTYDDFVLLHLYRYVDAQLSFERSLSH